MSANESRIIYTETDEAPALATHSLLPIIQAFSVLPASMLRRVIFLWQAVFWPISRNSSKKNNVFLMRLQSWAPLQASLKPTL